MLDHSLWPQAARLVLCSATVRGVGLVCASLMEACVLASSLSLHLVPFLIRHSLRLVFLRHALPFAAHLASFSQDCLYNNKLVSGLS